METPGRLIHILRELVDRDPGDGTVLSVIDHLRFSREGSTLIKISTKSCILRVIPYQIVIADIHGTHLTSCQFPDRICRQFRNNTGMQSQEGNPGCDI